MRLDLRQRVLAAAEPDLQPEFVRAGVEGGERIAGAIRPEREPRQGDVQQQALPGPQRMAAAPSVESFRRRLEGLASLSAGGRRSAARAPDPSSPT